MKQIAKTAIVMMNLGGPANLDSVQPFLQRLFSDEEIIKLPFQSLAAKFISERRAPMVKKQYAEIGGGSPIRKWSELQASLLEKKLDEISAETAPHKAVIAFRYAEPLTHEAIAKITNEINGIERVVAFTQYPQYSCATTGSSLNELWRQIKSSSSSSSSSSQHLEKLRWSVIDSWYQHPAYIEAVSKNIEVALKSKFPENVVKNNEVLLLFSAHSIPQSVADRGDRYPSEVSACVDRVCARLNRNFMSQIVWQSKVGPTKWLRPRVDETLKIVASRGIKHVLVIPIAFTSDHIETLFELDITYKKLATSLGIETFVRSESLNDSPHFIDALALICKEHLQSNLKNASPQLKFRCVGCENPSCASSREFWC